VHPKTCQSGRGYRYVKIENAFISVSIALNIPDTGRNRALSLGMVRKTETKS